MFAKKTDLHILRIDLAMVISNSGERILKISKKLLRPTKISITPSINFRPNSNLFFVYAIEAYLFSLFFIF